MDGVALFVALVSHGHSGAVPGPAASPVPGPFAGLLNLPAPLYTLLGGVVVFIGGWMRLASERREFERKLTEDRAAMERKFAEDRGALERKLEADKRAMEASHRGAIELARQKAEADLQAAKQQAELDVQKAHAIADDAAERERKQKNDVIRLAVADGLQNLTLALNEMEKAIAALCRVAREKRSLSFMQNPRPFLDLTYSLHYPIARFRVLYEKYDQIKDQPLREQPHLWNLWQVATVIEKTFTADQSLAEIDPQPKYPPDAPQDLNPETFLDIMIVPDTKDQQLTVLRVATFRKQLQKKALDVEALSDARRVIEPFSPRATAVFWRILLAQLLLIRLYGLILAKGFDGDYDALAFETARFDAGPEANDPDGRLLADLAAARKYVADALHGALRDVV